MAKSLKGKLAVMSGVGSGFGKATAELFAKADQVDLILIDYNKGALDATAEVCRAAGSKVIALQGDVTKLETFKLALKEALENFGKVDFLINYAGGAMKVAPIEEMDDEITANYRLEPYQRHHELPDLHSTIQGARLRENRQSVPALVTGDRGRGGRLFSR